MRINTQYTEARPGIRLKQLQILRGKDLNSKPILPENNPSNYLNRIEQQFTNSKIQRNRSKSRKKIFQRKSLQSNQNLQQVQNLLKNLQQKTEIVQQQQLRIKGMQSQISELNKILQIQDSKLREYQQKIRQISNFKQTGLRKSTEELSKNKLHIQQLTQQIGIKNKEIETLKLELERANRCNKLIFENERLSQISNRNDEKQSFHTLKDHSFQKPKSYMNHANSLLTDEFFQKLNTHNPPFNSEDEFQYEKMFNINKQFAENQTKKRSQTKFTKAVHKNSKAPEFDQYSKRQNSKSFNKQTVFKSNQYVQKYEEQQPQYYSPLEINMTKTKSVKAPKYSEGHIDNSKQFRFEDLRNLQDFDDLH